MKPKLLLCLALVLSGGLFGCSTSKPHPVFPAFVFAADNIVQTKYFNDYLTNLNFEDYLANCGTNQIRCIWFENDSHNLGEVMTFYLRDEMVFSASDYYGNEMKSGSFRNNEARKLTHPQVFNLEKLIEQMPLSDKTVEFSRAVSVSIRRGDKVEIFHYDRRNTPPVIQRLYDIGGGYYYDGK